MTTETDDGVRAATALESAEFDAAAGMRLLEMRWPVELLEAVDAQAAREGIIQPAMMRELVKRGMAASGNSGRVPIAWRTETPHGPGYAFADEFLEAFPRFPLPPDPT